MVYFPAQISDDQWDTRPVPRPSYPMFCYVYAFRLQKSNDFQMDTQLKSKSVLNTFCMLYRIYFGQNKTIEKRYLSRHVCMYVRVSIGGGGGLS